MTSLPDAHQKGIVFNIQKYSLHDGEGIRTIIFLKGCSLLCIWCSNPESQELLPQVGCNPAKCLTVDECSLCENICPEDALIPNEDGRININFTKCTNCLECAMVCPSHALNTYGYEISVNDALKRVEEDSIFYLRSGGGLTLSGGEPLLQDRFSISLLREARKRRIDTCIETAGNISWAVLAEAALYLNEIKFDIKIMNASKHKRFIGFDNTLIKENLMRLLKNYPALPITVRTPVIPGINDTEQEIGEIVDFIKGNPNVTYEPLAYHRMGIAKYTYLGRDYLMKNVENLSQNRLAGLTEFARSRMNR